MRCKSATEISLNEVRVACKGGQLTKVKEGQEFTGVNSSGPSVRPVKRVKPFTPGEKSMQTIPAGEIIFHSCIETIFKYSNIVAVLPF